jgi:hypothetical protein
MPNGTVEVSQNAAIYSFISEQWRNGPSAMRRFNAARLPFLSPAVTVKKSPILLSRW